MCNTVTVLGNREQCDLSVSCSFVFRQEVLNKRCSLFIFKYNPCLLAFMFPAMQRATHALCLQV
jgi:hypothetical protein